MAPRRASDRIAIKAQQKEEEDKQAEIDKQQEKERLAEMKKQEAEAKEKERQIRAEKRQRGLFSSYIQYVVTEITINVEVYNHR